MSSPRNSDVIYLPPGAGRRYEMHTMSAVFKADGGETGGRYTVSEWWLAPHSQGPGAHQHAEDDLFYVLEGTMSFLLGDSWIDAGRGAFVLIPGGVIHDFRNRSDARAGILNFGVPGDFERNMPAIVDWFEKQPPGPA